ncbi:MAG: hypothetical protein M5T61_11910 [Acidimicrobiia bacterium]|nr:hypothetical protein [Acidimicrobiia bacterium]
MRCVAGPRLPTHEGRVYGQEQVEAELGGEGPRLLERTEDVWLEVDVGERVEGDESAEARYRVVGARQHEDHEGDGDPERREDAQEAAPEIWARCGRRPVLEARRDERSVEEEAGDEEERRDTDVEARRVRAPEVAAQAEAADERRVGHCDRERRDRPQPVETGEVHSGSDLRVDF